MLRNRSGSRYGTRLYGAWVSEEAPEQLICSARRCRSTATTDLVWRNPTLHTGGRTKHWLACDEHADHLAEFLSRRGFLLGREPLDKT